MTESDYERLESIYALSEAALPMTSGNAALADAVHFGTNRQRPIHRWFNFKEGFSANLFEVLSLDTSALLTPESIFLDPFCGSGTTLLAGDLEHQWTGQRIGLEINPFIAFVATTKVDWRSYDPDRIMQLAEKVLGSPLSQCTRRLAVPKLSTFHNPNIFERARLNEMLSAVARVSEIDEPEQAPLLLGIAAAAERVGYFRRDGRALRILRSPGELAERRNLQVADALRAAWSAMAEDLASLAQFRGKPLAESSRVIIDDGRNPASREVSSLVGGVDLIAYSPPYLNHIDYTEVYKVELWLLGLVKTQAEMLSLRRQTLRSHASIGVGESTPRLPPDVEESVAISSQIVMRFGSNWHRSFRRLVLAYLEDMSAALNTQLSLLRPGGRAICVIANSAHGAKEHRVPIATDIWVARMAQTLGFEVEQLVVARQLARRNHINRFLRESVIVLRKPKA